MSKKAVVIWLAAFVLLVGAVTLAASQTITICWDMIEVDEPLLMDLCGMTREEYFSLDFKYEDCPQAAEAMSMVGGCDPDWQSIFPIVGYVAVGYLVVSGLAFGVWRLKKTAVRD